MVNKQYTVQSGSRKLSNRGSHPLPSNRNVTVLSRIPNPEQNYNVSNIDDLSMDMVKSSHGSDAVDDALDRSHPCCVEDYTIAEPSTDDDESRNTSDMKDISINDIGRFQYILQMDHEMGSSNSSSSLHCFPNDNLPNAGLNFTTNMQKNPDELSFWKADSKMSTHLPYTPTPCQTHSFYKYKRIMSKYAKWLLALLAIGGIVGILLYILEIENNLNADTSADNNGIATDQHHHSHNSQRGEKVPLSSINYNYNHVNRSDIQFRPFDVSNKTKANYKSKSLDAMIHDVTTIATLTTSSNKYSYATKLDVKNQTALNEIPQKIMPALHYPSSVNVPRYTVSVTSRVTTKQNLKTVTKAPVTDSTTDSLIEQVTPKIMFPSKETLQGFGFTSGHQNNFGIPIEEDERILRILNAQLINSNNANDKEPASTTDLNVYHTKVSPTLPVLNRFASTTETAKYKYASEGSCQSTSLSLCRDVLQYDLTELKKTKSISSTDMEELKYLLQSNCSIRAHEFICSVLEPECRPQQMGSLLPCRRVCKAILEPCAAVVASSEFLTSIFDCDVYLDSNSEMVCKDITRNTKCLPNEFQCKDRTCIPSQWQCDNIKDCSDAEDEESCTFCQPDEFRCPGTDKCIPEKWFCDNHIDCQDGADERDCVSSESWENDQADNARYLSNPIGKNGRIEKKIASLTKTKLFPSNSYVTSKNTNKTEKSDSYDDLEVILSAASGPVVPVSKNLENFQDSKEIMMTSDTKAEYKYSTVERSTSTTGNPGTCAEGELRCINGHCITLSQLCDRVTDCPDGADEAMCV